MEDDDYTIKLDTNIEVQTIVRNRFEEFEDLYHNDPFSHYYSVSSDEEQVETESSQASGELRDLDNVASAGSDVSENYASAVSDISAESTDSMAVDVPVHEVMKAQAAASKESSKDDPFSTDSRLKFVNCKELIVFLIDMSSDMEKVPYIIADENAQKVSVYSFPTNMKVKENWLRAIMRDDFEPTKHSKVCEQHFLESNIQRSTSAYDEKTGKLIEAPLKFPWFDDRDIKYNLSKDDSCPFLRQSGDSPDSRVKQGRHSPLGMVKRAIGMFVHNKHFIDKKHEYSLMVLYDTATWVCEFTNNPSQLMDALEDVTETLDCNSCDLASVIAMLTQKCPFILSPDFLPADIHRICRVILIYGRTNCMVEFSDPSAKEIFMDYPSLFLDIVYIHEPQSEDNKCLEIYEALCNLDDKDKSYIFETTRSITNLHNAFGKLLAHPYQRVPQKNANYRLQDIVPQEKNRRC